MFFDDYTYMQNADIHIKKLYTDHQFIIYVYERNSDGLDWFYKCTYVYKDLIVKYVVILNTK